MQIPEKLRHLQDTPLSIIPLLLYMALIFRLSSRKAPQIASLAPDYVLHFLCYFVFFIFAWIAFHGTLPQHLRGYNRSLALLFSILYGLSDEIHQYFVISRHASFSDFLADSIGAYCSFLLVKSCVILWRTTPEQP